MSAHAVRSPRLPRRRRPARQGRAAEPAQDARDPPQWRLKRFELTFEERGLTFDKGRPARLFMTEMATRPAESVDAATKPRFLRLFSVIVERMTTAVAAAA